MKPVALLLALGLLAGCASGPLVQTDRDPSADFQHYRSYGWKQEPAISNPLLKQRVVAAVDAELAAKGWRQAPEAQADLLLVGNVSSRDDIAMDYYYNDVAWSGWDWRWGGAGMHRIDVHTFKVGTLILDVFDATTKRAIWRATAEGTVPASEAHRSEDAMDAVHRMFADFPTAPASQQ